MIVRHLSVLAILIMALGCAFILTSCTVVYNPPPATEKTTESPLSATETISKIPKQDSEKNIVPEESHQEIIPEKYRPKNIAEAIRACNIIQEDNDIPIACEVKYVQGNPAMYIMFPNEDTSQYYISEMLEYIALPFCDSANKSNRQAFLIFVHADTETANLYSCETDKLTGWFNINDLYEM